MRIILAIALLLPMAAVAQTSPPSNAASGSGTPVGPPPAPAVPPPSNQSIDAAAPHGKPGAVPQPDTNTSVPEK